MNQISTKNALTDFDMCLALAQVSVDTQMEYAWKAWKRRKKFTDRIDVFKLKKRDGTIGVSKYGLSVKLAPLTVSLTVPDGKQGQVRVTLKMESGKVVYYDEEDEEKAEYPVKDWSVSFVTDLDKKQVSLDQLRQIDPDTHKTAESAIKSTELPESVFTIEYLFLKLTEVDLILSDNKNIKIPKDVPRSARDKALSCLNLLLQPQGDKDEYVLGTVVRRNRKQATPTFALTDFIFDVHANWSKAHASTLNYLGEFSGRGLPADINAARLKLTDAWVRPEQLDGTEANVAGIMAISKEVFFGKYLIPEFQKKLSAPPDFKDLTWTFKKVYYQVDKRVDPVRAQINVNYTLAISVKPSTNTLSISGKLYSSALLEIDVVGANAGSTAVAVHQGISGSVALAVSGAGSKFNLIPKLEYKFGEVTTDKDETTGITVIVEAFGQLIKTLKLSDKSPHEMLHRITGELQAEIKGALEDTLNQINLDLSQHTFIPPGGGVFTFQNPCFSDAGDLFFEVIYLAP